MNHQSPEQEGKDWIKIAKNNLPEIGKWVLLFNGHWTGVGKYSPNEDEEYLEPEWQDETSEYIAPYPTHYMQLPNPPGAVPSPSPVAGRTYSEEERNKFAKDFALWCYENWEGKNYLKTVNQMFKKYLNRKP